MNTEQFGQFARTFGRRRSRKEKNRFVENLQPVFRSYGYDMKLYEQRIGLRKITHVVFGEPARAKFVYVAGYDTNERLIMGNGKYWPLEESRNRAKSLVNLTIYMLLSLAAAVIGIMIIRQGLSYESWRRIVMIASGVGFILLGNAIAQGMPNQTTFAKTSSIFLLFELAGSLKTKDNAFVFLDYGSFSRLGLDFMVKNEIITSSQTVIYFDCFSDGDRLLIGYGDKARKKAEEIKAGCKKRKAVLVPLSDNENNRFTGLDNWIILANVYKDSDESLYVDNVRTDDDLTVDPETIDAVVKILREMGDAK